MAYTGTQSFLPEGTQLQRGDVATQTNFVTVAEVTKVQRSGSKVDTLDATNMDSTGAYREKLPGLIDAGQIQFDGNFIPSDVTQQNLQTDMDGRSVRNWRVQLPNALGRWDFKAFIVQLDFDLDPTKIATITSKMEISGKPVFTPAV